MTHSITTEAPKPLPLREGFVELARQFREFVVALWSSQGRRTLTLLTVAIILVICATAAAQVALNAWNRPFYDAVQEKNFSAFLQQLVVFAMLASGLLVLNVAQAWLREMIKLKSREWLTRDLFAEWLKPGRATRLAYAGEIGVNPDQRIHEDARHLTELAADLGIGLFQASLLLVSFLGVLWTLSGPLAFSIGGYSFSIPGYMVWCALLYAATGSWLTWRVGRSLVGLNSARYQRESELRFALVQANQHAESIAHQRGEQSERQRLILDLDNVLAMMRAIVSATARLTWVTAGYGWIAIVAPIVIAAPGYFGGNLSFGELMMVVGGFYQVNQSLRWFVDNFPLIAEWRATLHRVMSFREVLLTFESDLRSEERIHYDEHPEGNLAFEGIGFAGPVENAKLDAEKVDVGPGDRILIVDETRGGKAPLLPAIAGHWPWGSGKLQHPDGRIMFLNPRPYFPKGSLRAALAYPGDPLTVSNADAATVLARVGLGHLAKSLDRTARWWRKLDSDEQARLALARLLLHKPQWVFADGIINAIAEEHRELVISIFENELADTALVSVSRRGTQGPLCRRVFRLTPSPAHDSSGRVPHSAEA
jgi:vitamin B12/bleomycin/antimicrobial peptide transport system ATP-binding/permease protein